ncbi:cold-shock protein [Halomonas halocynthiae]|uniref:cold-shock protein n=1 Tax=Halomonas halocynthiae TaxID=176290 RepID=UPI00040B67F9|nr:cold-shock protein [Halomonas halocynthiae]
MNLNVVLRSCFFSLLLALPAPWLIGLFADWFGGQPAQLALQGYVAVVVAVFLLMLVATLIVGARGARSAPSTGQIEIEDDGREIGEVKWFNVNKGYGFITRDTGEDVFVHFRAIRGHGHRTLAEGQKVKYHTSHNDRGLQADDVTVIT